jgi:hypothetical protein
MFLHLLLYLKIVNFEFAQNQHLDFINYSENKFIMQLRHYYNYKQSLKDKFNNFEICYFLIITKVF